MKRNREIIESVVEHQERKSTPPCEQGRECTKKFCPLYNECYEN